MTDEPLLTVVSNISDAVLAEVLAFYNANFPKSQHTLAGKARRYSDSAPINIIARDDYGHVIGLLESRRKDGEPRQLITLLVEEPHRGTGLARKLWEALLDEMELHDRIGEIFLHIRESERSHLEPIYIRFGFEPAIRDGVYPKSKEPRLKMTRR